MIEKWIADELQSKRDLQKVSSGRQSQKSMSRWLPAAENNAKRTPEIVKTHMSKSETLGCK